MIQANHSQSDPPTSFLKAFSPQVSFGWGKALVLLIVMGFVSSCSVREAYEPPTVQAPNEWSFAQEDAFNVLDQTVALESSGAFSNPIESPKEWWRIFKDEDLDRLMTRALAHNYSSRIALARIEQALGYLETIHGSRFPQVEGSVGFDRATLSASNPTSASRSKLVSLFESEIGVSWELDLFGKLKNQEAAALASLEGQGWAKAALDLVLKADVCTCYFKIRRFQLEKDLAEQLIKEQELEVSLIKDQMQVGLVDETVLLKSQMALEGFKKQYYALVQEIQHYSAVLSFLTTIPLEELISLLRNKPADLAFEVPVISLQRPVQVIKNRPDLQEAERELAASYALTAAALGDFYPSVSLSGLFGYIDSSRSIGQFAYGGGVTALIPLLNFGVLEGRLAQAQAEEKQALLTFQEAMLKAFLDVEKAMTKLLEAKTQGELSDRLLKQKEDIVALFQSRVDVGLESELALSQERRSLLQERIGRVQTLEIFLESYIQAIKALGGAC